MSCYKGWVWKGVGNRKEEFCTARSSGESRNERAYELSRVGLCSYLGHWEGTNDSVSDGRSGFMDVGGLVWCWLSGRAHKAESLCHWKPKYRHFCGFTRWSLVTLERLW